MGVEDVESIEGVTFVDEMEIVVVAAAEELVIVENSTEEVVAVAQLHSDESKDAKSGKASHVNTTLLQMSDGMYAPDVS